MAELDGSTTLEVLCDEIAQLALWGVQAGLSFYSIVIYTALVDEEHLNHLSLRTLTISILNISSNTAFYSITKANVLSDSIIRSFNSHICSILFNT